MEFKLPDLGEGIHEAEILSIKVKEGETVKEDQPLFEVETDKAVVEIPCPVAGKVDKIMVKEGQTVTVGSVMITFSGGEEKTPVKVAAAKTEEKSAAASVAAKSTGNGRSTAVQARENQEGRWPVPAAPATRKLARELGVDINAVPASGPGGRVTNEDIRSFAAGSLESRVKGGETTSRKPVESSRPTRSNEPAEPVDLSPMTATPADLPDFTKWGEVERVPLRSLRRKIAQNMTTSWTHIPHVTHCDEANITNLDAFMAQNADEMKERGGRLTLTVFALKAIASALIKYPMFNASLDEKSGELVYKKYYNIGIAVATERGLIVPVIKNVDKKSVPELCVELAEIADKTRSGKIELDRLQGGTFTLTNIGAIGGTGMSPMVNYPEAAILGMARSAQKPIVKDGKIEIGTILPLALSFDHRITDGAEAAYFMRHIVKRLEQPLGFLIES